MSFATFIEQTANPDLYLSLNVLATTLLSLSAVVMHWRCEGNRKRIAELEDTVPPGADQILELYNTADKTLQALHKFTRARGRAIQADAAAVAANADAQTTEQALPKRPLVGGRTGTVGGLIRRR